MSNGAVKWFNAEKVMDLFHRNPEMIFVHFSAIQERI